MLHIKKYAVLICILLSVSLLLIATILYPGGSIADKDTIGFCWTKNFISNLFAAKAINGADNPSQFWAITGMVFHSLGYGIFFVNMSKKITHPHSSSVLKIIGFANVFFSVLIVTPWHDVMVTLSSTLFLMGLFYITVFIFKTKRHLFKLACIICLLVFYYTLFLYGCGNWGLLAILQKVATISSMGLVIALEYFTRREDFEQIIKINSDK